MEFSKLIEKRKSYRKFVDYKISDNEIYQIARAASKAPSCYNNQPWRFLFVKKGENFDKAAQALVDGNSWAKKASMLIIVYSNRENDCIVKDREYYQFDTGMATNNLIMKIFDLGLIAHPMAGFSPKIIRKNFELSKENKIITMIAVGKHDDNENYNSPKRMEFERFAKIY